ncbi:WhiB family transcriptional regulator [Mycobacterium sp. 4D054]|uniref:WhiB family transcriptional regulator n=1 Tax=Mycobacterium sp. 4D054 TaxID=3457440 RepID=UPI003FD4E66A
MFNAVEDLRLAGQDGTAWGLVAPCQAVPDLVWAEDEASIEKMQKLCGMCRIQATCSDLRHGEPEGVWGGATEKDGRSRRGLLDPGHIDRYDQRHAKARKCRAALLSGAWREHPRYEHWSQVCEQIEHHPTENCALLAARIGKSRSWFEQRFAEVCNTLAV